MLCVSEISFFFFNWTPKLSWIKVVKVDIFVLFLILEEMLSVFLPLSMLNIMLAVSLLYIPLICWGMHPVYNVDNFLKSEIDVEFCQKFFSDSTEMIIGFLFFSWLIQCIKLIGLQILNYPCISGINSTWSWCKILFMQCWILFADILL